MTDFLTFTAGDVVTLFIEVINLNEARQDGYTVPVINSIKKPDLSNLAGYPVAMTKISTGMYSYSFTLPSLVVGTYFADAYWYEPDFQSLRQKSFQIEASAPVTSPISTYYQIVPATASEPISLAVYQPGQVASAVINTLDGYGALADTVSLPTVRKIIFPNGSLAAGFPVAMTRLDTGVYKYNFTLPIGAGSIGMYLVVVQYIDIPTSNVRNKVIQVMVTAPFGNFTVSPA